MDFGPFGDGTDNSNANRAPSRPTQDSSQQSDHPQNVNNTSTDSAPVFMHNMEHQGVFCDVCEGPIRGFRYKCMQCADFDLCSGCERKGNHAGHVMMRISFPEQTRDAIRRYLDNAPGSPPRGGFPETLFGAQHSHHRGHRGCHRTSRHEPSASGNDTSNNKEKESEGESGGEDRYSSGCPYGLGRRGMKKWAKSMKKMAYQQRRSAESYARTCAQAAAQASGMGIPTTRETQGARREPESQLNFTAAASQIQEFLNAFGIPIDVVELYDSFGNHGRPRGEQATEGATGQTEGQTKSQDTTGENTTTVSDTVTGQINTPILTPTVAENPPPQATLAAHLQHLHLNATSGNTETNTAPSASAPPQDPFHPVTMDIDGESSGWTFVDNEKVASPTSSNIGSVPPPTAFVTAPKQAHVTFAMPSSESPSLNSADVSSATGSETTTSAAPPSDTSAVNNGLPGGRVYPILSPPQLQQLLSGVSQAMNSVVRNIPIVTNPSGPGVTLASSQQPQTNGAVPEMDTKCMTTLNQLLAMGFSNHDGWLSRLVVAKKGDLEAVLNALFPGNGA